MMITTVAKNSMLATLSLTHVSLHSSEPGIDGTTGEIGVTRGAVMFGSPSDGRITLTADVIMSIVDPINITHIGYWNETTFILSQPISTEVISEPSNFKLQANTTYIEI